jgi:hypothetical protein
MEGGTNEEQRNKLPTEGREKESSRETEQVIERK